VKEHESISSSYAEYEDMYFWFCDNKVYTINTKLGLYFESNKELFLCKMNL
jgi:hypothetical protein